MGLTLAKALRIASVLTPRGWELQGKRKGETLVVAFVGAGGKSTAMFQLARELRPPVIVTTTTHLGTWQADLADEHIVVLRSEHAAAETARDVGKNILTFSRHPTGSSEPPRHQRLIIPESDWPGHLELSNVTVITGPVVDDERLSEPLALPHKWLFDTAKKNSSALLVESDGARQRPLKAPGKGEPNLLEYSDLVVVVAGLSALDKPLADEVVHRANEFALVSSLQRGNPITPEAVARVLLDTQGGGLKGIPEDARRVALLNQADSPELESQARGMVSSLLQGYDAVIIASLKEGRIEAVHERAAGIVLAAGGSQRLGRSKQLLDWHGQPFVRVVASTALAAGLDPVVVVTGADAVEVEAAVAGLPVKLERNEAWQTGQSASIRAGVQSLPSSTGSAVFLLSDQPQIRFDVIQALVDLHATGLHPIVAPLVMMEQRANPVLFDRVTFRDLLSLEGDVGGRAVFSKHHVEYLPWHDDRLLLDVDTEADYRRLIEDDTL